MQIVYEVRKATNNKEQLYPVATAANGAAAKKKASDLNKVLAKNKAIMAGLQQRVRTHLSGNRNFLEPKELAQYEALTECLEIVEYRTEFINDKRVGKYNPQFDVTKIEPTKEQIERSTKARTEAGFIEPEPEKEPVEVPEPSKTALKILEEAKLDWKELKGSGKDGLITVADAKKFAADAAKE